MLMKKVILLLSLCFIYQGLSSQTLKKNYSPGSGAHINSRAIRESLQLNDRTGNSVVAPPASNSPSANKTSNLDVQPLGQASNAYTSITPTANQVFAVDGATDASDVVGWIHRQNVEVHGGAPSTTANGILRIDLYQGESLTQCEANEWKLDIGPLNPMPYPNAGRCRYPQITPYVPSGAKNVNDWKFVWAAPMTDGQGWGNYCWGVTWDACNLGVKKWNEPKANLTSNWGFLGKDQNNDVLIPGGLSEGKKGDFWFVDNSYRPTGESTGKNGDSVFVFKYTVNSNNDVQWTKKTLRIPNVLYNTKKDQYEVGETNLAFSPDGKWGWVSVMAIIDDPDNPGEFEQKPNLFWTDNSGDTWNGPIVVRPRDYPAVVDELKTRYLLENGDTTVSTGIPMPLGAPDLAVDKFGNPHLFMNFGNTSRETPDLDSLYYFQAFMGMFDITTGDNGKTWCPKFLHRTVKYQGTIPSSTLSFDNYLQIARDPSGERIFYSWIDDTVTSTQSSAMKPDLHTRALRVTDNAMTDTDVSTLNDGTWKGKVFFPAMAPIVLEKEKGSKFLLPTIFLRLSGNENQPTDYFFIKNRFVNESDFKAASRDISMDVIAPAEKICFGEETDVTVSIKNVSTEAVTDSLKVSYSINGKDGVVETIRLDKPIPAGGSIQYTFKEKAVIPQSGSYAFELSTYWNGDLNCSNHYKERIVMNFGGKEKDIFSGAEQTGCGSVVLNTGLTGYTHTWTQDGTPMAETGPMISFDQVGSYDVKVEVASPDCQGQKLVDNIKIIVNPLPEITLKPFYQLCTKDAPLKASILDGGSSEYEYTWKRYAGKTLSTVATSNEYAVKSNGKFRVTIKNKTTGCENQKDVDVFIWDLKAAIKGGTSCGISALDASNESTGPGCTYTWFIDGVQKASGPSSIFFTVTDYEATPRKYKVIIDDPMKCGTSEKEVTIQTWTKTDTSGTTQGLDAYIAKQNYDFAEEGTTKILSARTTDSDEIKQQRAIYLCADPKHGTTKLTGTEWRISPSSAATMISPIGKKFTAGKYGGPNTIVENNLALFYSSVGRNRKLEYIVHSGICSDTTRFIFEVVSSGGESENSSAAEARACNPVSRDNYAYSGISGSIYPNPNTGTFKIKAELSSVKALDVVIYDINGRVVYSNQFTDQKIYNETIDLNHVSKGIYVVKMITEEGFTTQRVVKE